MTTSGTTTGRSPVARAGATVPTRMRAIVQDRYGRPEDVLRLAELPVPTAKADEVVVRLHAASIHVGDLVGIRGEPRIARLAFGLRRPKHRVPGTDVAGTVVAVGGAVPRLRPGDEVFGWCTEGFAEYACGPADHFVPRPSELTPQQAAAVGVSACAALQLLRGRVRPGDAVLINGASGGLGSYAVQIARALGAEVTGVCSTGNVEVVRSLGARHVIDYTEADFPSGEERYDFILDNIGNHSLSRTRRTLKPRGVLQSNNGTSGGRWFGTLGTVLSAAIASMVTHRQARPSVRFPTREDLVALTGLIEAGRVTPLLGRHYPLGQAARAIAHVGEGHARGTVILEIGAQTART